jgi:hypothetical protein
MAARLAPLDELVHRRCGRVGVPEPERRTETGKGAGQLTGVGGTGELAAVARETDEHARGIMAFHHQSAGAADLADRRRRAHGRPGELEAGPVTLMREPLWKPHHVVRPGVHGNDQLASRGHFPGCVDELSHMGPRVAVLVDDLAGSVAEAQPLSRHVDVAL